MRPRLRAAAGSPTVCLTPRACLSLFLSAFCLAPLGPAPSLFAAPSAASSASLSANSPKNKKTTDPSLKGLPITELTADEAIVHALNRLAYGPRPGDVERIKQMGLAKWIDQQLHPESIDDHAMEARLEQYPTLKMSSAQLIAKYPPPKQTLKREQRRAQAAARPAVSPASVATQDAPGQSGQDARMTSSGEQANAQESTEDANAPAPMKQPEDNPPARVAGKRADLGVNPESTPRALSDESRRPQRVVAELAMAKMIRAIYSERQLQQ